MRTGKGSPQRVRVEVGSGRGAQESVPASPSPTHDRVRRISVDLRLGDPLRHYASWAQCRYPPRSGVVLGYKGPRQGSRRFPPRSGVVLGYKGPRQGSRRFPPRSGVVLGYKGPRQGTSLPRRQGLGKRRRHCTIKPLRSCDSQTRRSQPNRAPARHPRVNGRNQRRLIGAGWVGRFDTAIEGSVP